MRLLSLEEDNGHELYDWLGLNLGSGIARGFSARSDCEFLVLSAIKILMLPPLLVLPRLRVL